ncbi:BAI1-associated protein 3 [Portunus trituberculatus]|uniref:BAI1-associated protein 3 n=1 Tax=Portunus trituberculatus TaxID=210409 RepID=A0A5B7CHV1_PORTR|nr:BAI1-associated protein 3 [Portunus trituberculatus]
MFFIIIINSRVPNSTSLKIPYAAINYKIFEKLLSEDALKVLTVIQVDEDIENEIWQMCALLRDLELNKETPYYNPHCSTSPFLLYLALAEFSKFQEHVAASERRALLLGSVWGHFLPAVSRWVDVTAFRVFYRIRVAILTDRVANTGEPVQQYTTSAVDTTSCFYHVKTFWRHLAWPDLSTSYSLVVRMVETMSGAADYYVHLLQQRLSTLATDTTDMERAQQLCITVNNMEHVRHSLTLLQEELQLDHLTQQLDAQDGQGGTTYADHIGSLLLEALTNLDAKIANSMSPVAEQLHKTTTETLIETYHMERLMEQERVESQEYGSLFVRAYFNHDSLCVEHHLPTGFSDPFVVIELLPRRLFPGAAQQQTNVHKKTLHPLFDECFELLVSLWAQFTQGCPASLESCQAEGAMILFTLMDHDVITCNDFGGEAFLSLNTISGVVASSSSVDNFHGLKPIELSLMFQKDPDNSILKVLETRTSDKVALEFVKKQKERIARPT